MTNLSLAFSFVLALALTIAAIVSGGYLMMLRGNHLLLLGGFS